MITQQKNHTVLCVFRVLKLCMPAFAVIHRTLDFCVCAYRCGCFFPASRYRKKEHRSWSVCRNRKGFGHKKNTRFVCLNLCLSCTYLRSRPFTELETVAIVLGGVPAFLPRLDAEKKNKEAGAPAVIGEDSVTKESQGLRV